MLKRTERDSRERWSQGQIEISYARLVARYGEPNGMSGYKVRAEWLLEAEDGSLVAIHDWKTDGPIEDNTYWTVSADNDSSDAVVEALNIR